MHVSCYNELFSFKMTNGNLWFIEVIRFWSRRRLIRSDPFYKINSKAGATRHACNILIINDDLFIIIDTAVIGYFDWNFLMSSRCEWLLMTKAGPVKKMFDAKRNLDIYTSKDLLWMIFNILPAAVNKYLKSALLLWWRELINIFMLIGFVIYRNILHDYNLYNGMFFRPTSVCSYSICLAGIRP